MEFGFPQAIFVGGEIHPGAFDGLVPHLAGGIDAGFVGGDFFPVQVVADDLEALLGEGHRQGHAHVAQAHHRKGLLPGLQSVVQRCHLFLPFLLPSPRMNRSMESMIRAVLDT